LFRNPIPFIPFPLIRGRGNFEKRGWRFSATLLNSPWERDREALPLYLKGVKEARQVGPLINYSPSPFRREGVHPEGFSLKG